jgi:hypothetical protein
MGAYVHKGYLNVSYSLNVFQKKTKCRHGLVGFHRFNTEQAGQKKAAPNQLGAAFFIRD